MGIDDQIKQIEASLKARQERLKQLEKEKRQRLIRSLGRLVLKETKITSVAEFKANYVIVRRRAEKKPRLKTSATAYKPAAGKRPKNTKEMLE